MPLLETRTISFHACQSKLETSVYLKLNQGDYDEQIRWNVLPTETVANFIQ